jgi:hypothetical protein
VARMMVEVCPDAGLTMRFDIPMWQSGDLAARTINHLAIFVAERAGWLKHPSKSPRHPANVGQSGFNETAFAVSAALVLPRGPIETL